MSYGMNRGMTGANLGHTSTGNFKEKIPSGYKKGAIQQFTPQQMELFSQLFSQTGPESYLSRLAGGDEDIFNQIEAPAMRQFSGFQGNIASRFSGEGGGRGPMSSRRSSGFQNTMNQASSDFSQNLASRRQELQRQALMDLMGISSSLLSERPYEQFLIKKEQKQPFWKKLLGIVSPLGGDIASGGTENTQNFFKTLGSFGGM